MQAWLAALQQAWGDCIRHAHRGVFIRGQNESTLHWQQSLYAQLASLERQAKQVLLLRIPGAARKRIRALHREGQGTCCTDRVHT